MAKNTLTKKELVELVQQQLGGSYHNFEIEDVINGLIAAMKEAFMNGQSVRLEGLLSIEPVVNEPRMWRNVSTNSMSLTKRSISLKLKTSVMFKNLFKGEFNEEGSST